MGKCWNLGQGQIMDEGHGRVQGHGRGEGQCVWLYLASRDGQCLWVWLHLASPDVSVDSADGASWGLIRYLYTCPSVIELSKWRWFFVGGGSREELGGRHFFPHWVEKEMGGRILSSIIEERGKWRNKLSIWCKSFIRNLFKISSHCLPQQYLIIISSVGVIEIQVIEIHVF